MKVELIDHMGDDLAIVNAARVSFNKESNWVQYTCGDGCCYEEYLSDADTKLIKYLAKHDHWTPFAHTSISLRMQAPVPIRTQCFKHKQGFVENEESRRYVSDTPTLFVPDAFRSKPDGSIKQGSGGVHYDSEDWKDIYRSFAKDAINLYEQMITDGVCPEQARFVLPQGVEVQWIWTGNLYAFANFFNKRTDPHAQKEIQDLARMVGDIIEPLFPVSWTALVKETTDGN
jgi:thymidylate synthase (FAD)